MSELFIHRANKNDLPLLSEMRLTLWPEDTQDEHLRQLTALIGQDSFQNWIAFHGKKHIGFAEASIRPYANGCDGRPVVFLEGIWVAESHRNSGIGQKLVGAIEDWAKSKGISEIGSDAPFSNTLSHACHKKWGFEETERVVYFRKKLT